jgi:hypothetical protein
MRGIVAVLPTYDQHSGETSASALAEILPDFSTVPDGLGDPDAPGGQ